MGSAVKDAVHWVMMAAQRAGLETLPIAKSGGGWAGVRLRWGKEGPDAISGTVVSASSDGVDYRFFVANPWDLIQASHRRGKFYEEEELDIIRRYFKGGVFVDIGANVGNHSLYALLFLDAQKVIAFEPNPEAYRILETNIALNQLGSRFQLHKVGLADKPGFAVLKTFENNLGAARFAVGENASGLEIKRGDDVLRDEAVTFVKIDTEGFEMMVLSGLRETLTRKRPTLFIEVENANIPAFEQYLRDVNYRIAEEFRRYDQNTNYVAVPA